MTIPDPRAQRAYLLYVEEGLSLRAVACDVHADRLRIRRWIVERGGEIRLPWCRSGITVRGKGRPKRVCSIGPVRANREAVGAMFCAAVCALTYYEGKCDEETSVQDLAAFAEFEAKREADAKLIAERKAQKLSGNALWRGVRGNVKWR